MEAEIKQLSQKPWPINYLTKEAVHSDSCRLHKTPQMYLEQNRLILTNFQTYSTTMEFYALYVSCRGRVSKGTKTERILMRVGLCVREIWK